MMVSVYLIGATIFSFHLLCAYTNALIVVAPRNGVLAPCTETRLEAATNNTDYHKYKLSLSPPCWFSSLQGSIGCGWTLDAVLTVGLHTLTASSFANTSEAASVEVLVRPPHESVQSWSETLALCFATEKLPPKRNGMQWQLEKIPQNVNGIFNVTTDILHNPTNVNAVSGNGGLTAAFSQTGVLTALRWPTPSSSDHVDYLTTNRSKVEKGARGNMGAFAGIQFTFGNGTKTPVSWLHLSWSCKQMYDEEDNNIVNMTCTSEDLCARADITSFVVPDEDILAQSFHVKTLDHCTDRDNMPTSVTVLYYSNFAPCTFDPPLVPASDWLLDIFNDYAALYDRDSNSFLHFRPQNISRATAQVLWSWRNTTKSADAAKQFNVNVLGSNKLFKRGVYIATGPSNQLERAGMNVLPVTDAAPNASFDSIQSAVFGNAATVYRSPPLRLDANHSSVAAQLYTVIASSADEARIALTSARNRSFHDHLRRARVYWSNHSSHLRLPSTAVDQVRKTSLRSLITIKTSTSRFGVDSDSRMAAVSASVASQPPYAADWPRDGSFVNAALEAAGLTGESTSHNRFYARVQRTSGPLGGTYGMNYGADGVVQGPIPLELDETGLALKSMSDNSRRNGHYLDAAWRNSTWVSIQRSAEFLVRWRSKQPPYLPLPANEDDSPSLKVGLEDCCAVCAGLVSAAKLAALITGHNATAERWMARALEVRHAISQVFFSTSAQVPGTFVPKDVTGPQSLRGASWILSLGIFPQTDSRLAKHAEALWNATSPIFRGVPGIYAYNAEQIYALSTYSPWMHDSKKRNLLEQSLVFLCTHVATQGTNHFGEHYELISRDPVAVVNINNMPHCWEHALVYLAALNVWPAAE